MHSISRLYKQLFLCYHEAFLTHDLVYVQGKPVFLLSCKLHNSKVNNGIMYHKSVAMPPRA